MPLKVCMLGGTGFVGRALTSRLSAQGHQVCIVTRHQARHRDLLVYPTVRLVEGDAQDLGLLRTLFQGADVVINLVGILNERGHDGRGFHRVHVELAGKVAEACTQARVPRLLHMSALNASLEAPSHYLRTKAEGEDLVHAEARQGVQVTSFRPSVIFGPGDSFLNRFADLLHRIPWVFPLACPGARFQPVYVGDVAEAFIRSIGDHHCYGRRYDLCGPRVYTLRQLVEYVAYLSGLRRRIIELSPWQSWLQAACLEWVPGKPFSLDNYRSLQRDSVCQDAPWPARFGTPRPLEEIAPSYLRPRRDRLDALRRWARRA